MKKLLLIALLIVGCEEPTEPEDEIKEVAWLLTQDTSNINESAHNFNGTKLYWTDGNKPTIIDTFEVTECEDNEYGGIKFDCGTLFYTYLHQDDTLYSADSVNTIFHFVEPNYIETTYRLFELTHSQRFYPEDYEVFNYEYK